jgi:hypothetical protein
MVELVRVAVLWNAAATGSVLELKDILPVEARALKLSLQPWEVRDADDSTGYSLL